MKTMAADDVTYWEHVEDEEDGAKHWALGDSVGDRGGVGFVVVDGDVLEYFRQVGGEPGEGGVSDET